MCRWIRSLQFAALVARPLDGVSQKKKKKNQWKKEGGGWESAAGLAITANFSSPWSYRRSCRVCSSAQLISFSVEHHDFQSSGRSWPSLLDSAVIWSTVAVVKIFVCPSVFVPPFVSKCRRRLSGVKTLVKVNTKKKKKETKIPHSEEYSSNDTSTFHFLKWASAISWWREVKKKDIRHCRWKYCRPENGCLTFVSFCVCRDKRKTRQWIWFMHKRHGSQYGQNERWLPAGKSDIAFDSPNSAHRHARFRQRRQDDGSLPA